MKTNEIRQKFLDYFKSLDHIIEPSSSLIPNNDKTLLFVNSGMVPFKDVLSGKVSPPYKRVASCQRCMRVGGKHNDLQNVGYTARHHTFFEMLGNFSFGDYFKYEAIKYAWYFLVVELKIPKERLWVSVFQDDIEAENIWINDIGFPKNRISRCGEKDNFWQMGETGPCGPCSEIFYDHGAHIAGEAPGHAGKDGDRYIEIWNLVFTQFERQPDGYLKPLAKPCVDTGMGLERLAAVLQHKNNNYDIDSFKDIINAIIKVANKDNKVKKDNASVRVIADHIRASVFMIVDGVIPENNGRGYVLRRIIRRAIRHGHKIGIEKLFFYKLASVFAWQTKNVYPQLNENLTKVQTIIKLEEQRFVKVLAQGMDILKQVISNLKGSEIDGATVFKLYDTYGFPLDLTTDIAAESGLTVDIKGFDKAMIEQKTRASKAHDFSDEQKNEVIINSATEFLGYKQLNNSSVVKALIVGTEQVQAIDNGDKAIVILEKSSFYGESCGQVGDKGVLRNRNVTFIVNDTQKQISGALEHYGLLKSDASLTVGDVVEVQVDEDRRKCIARNHSATHLLHAALCLVLGEGVEQKGSLVGSDKLRFDFSYDTLVARENLDKIENIVNAKILSNVAVGTDITDIETAKKRGAIAFFDEKYGKEVRVLTMGDDGFSIELCGGTHVKYLGDIGLFRITLESSIAAGIRRIEAVTGHNAYIFDNKIKHSLSKIAAMFKTSNNKVVDTVAQLTSKQKMLEKQIDALKKQLINKKCDELLGRVEKINYCQLLTAKISDVSSSDLCGMVDQLKDKLSLAIIVLATDDNKKISLVVGVTKDLSNNYHAGKILNYVAKQVDGRGGGRADMAQGGGSNLAKLSAALGSVKNLLSQ